MTKMARLTLEAGVSRRKQVMGIFTCALAVAVFQYLAVVLSMADFHPGGDVNGPDTVDRQAELGRAMAQPFTIPLIWVTRVTGFSSVVLVLASQWVALPLLYGSGIFYLGAHFWRLLRRALG